MDCTRSVVLPLFPCAQTSMTFDPYMCLSLSLPSDSQRSVTVSFVPLHDAIAASGDAVLSPSDAILTVTVRVTSQARMADVVRAVAEQVSVNADSLVAVDVFKNKVTSTSRHAAGRTSTSVVEGCRVDREDVWCLASPDLQDRV